MSALPPGALDPILPRSAVLSGDAAAPWASGDSADPPLVALPDSLPDLAAVMAMASGEGWRVAAAGAGSWKRRAATPGRVDLVVSTARLADVVHYEPADLTLTCEAGLPLRVLDQTARENGQWLPLDPAGWRGGTVGGLVATGSFGPLAASYGSPRAHVLGLTAVTGDGRVLEPGGRVVKNVAGFDLVKLLTGSGGALAILAKASLRLHPVPERDVTLLYAAGTEDELVPLARAVALAPVPVAALELLSRGVVDQEGLLGKAVVAARLLGTAEATHEIERRFQAAHGEPVAKLVGAASSAFFGMLSELEDDAVLGLRLSLLPSRLPDLVELTRSVFAPIGDSTDGRARARYAIHVTLGTSRLSIQGPDLPSGLPSRLRDLRTTLEQGGGSLRTVTGPPAFLNEVGRRGYAERIGRITATLRKQFDPADVLSAESVDF